MAKKYNVRNIVFGLWIVGSVHIERIRRAYLLSADMQMDMSVEVLKDAIKDPNLKMEQAGLYRELSLSYSRQAGFKNQSKFGKKPADLDMTKPVLQVNDEQMDRMIEEMRKAKIAELNHSNYIHFENVEPEKMQAGNVVQQEQDNENEFNGNEQELQDNEDELQNIINNAKNKSDNSSYDNDEFDLSAL